MYSRAIKRLLLSLIPEPSSVLLLGCRKGELIGYLKPERCTGVDPSEKVIAEAKKNYPEFEFFAGRLELIDLKDKFDYIIIT